LYISLKPHKYYQALKILTGHYAYQCSTLKISKNQQWHMYSLGLPISTIIIPVTTFWATRKLKDTGWIVDIRPAHVSLYKSWLCSHPKNYDYLFNPKLF